MNDRGFVTPAVLVVLLAGLVMVGLALDVARYAAAAREAAHVADTASEAAAAVIDPTQAYRGRLRIDRTGALRIVRAITHLHQARHQITGREVCVTVVVWVDPWILDVIGAGSKQVEASACASPAQG